MPNRSDLRPLVSICIPTYNNGSVLGDALSSALRQACSSLEVLVLDNCSTDDTEHVVRRISGGDARVRYVRHSTNIGMAGNFSACIAAATGEFVQILCADDALESRCAEELSAALRDEPDTVLAACGRTLVDETMRPLRVLRARTSREVVSGPRLARECFARGNRIGEPSAVMFRREAALRGFSAEYSQLVDLEMWFHLLGRGAAVLLPEALCLVRQHDRQATRANIRNGRIIRDKQLLFRQFTPGLMRDLSLGDKLFWDLRMASSVARVNSVGGVVDAAGIREVFFGKLFRRVLAPAFSLAARRGAVDPRS